MSAHPVPGYVYTAPTSAAVGGTLVNGLVEDRIEWEDGRGVRAFGSGLEADAWSMVPVQGEKPPALILPVRDVAAATLQLLFSHLSTGTTMHSHGGQGVPPFGDLPGVALVVRPKDTSQLYLYGPRWKMHPDCVKRLTWHRNVARFDGSLLVLCPQRSLDGSKKAFMFDSVSNINTYYGL